MDFGKYSAAVAVPVLNETKRGLLGMPLVSANGAKTFFIPLTQNLPSTLFKSSAHESLTFGVDCTFCGTKGTIGLTGYVESSFKNGLTVFSVLAVPKSFTSSLALKFSAKGTCPYHTVGMGINGHVSACTTVVVRSDCCDSN
jgi:hypothetical protein